MYSHLCTGTLRAQHSVSWIGVGLRPEYVRLYRTQFFGHRLTLRRPA